MASRLYGLTTGGVNAPNFELTQLGDAATGPDEDVQLQAKRTAVLSIEPYKQCLNAFNTKRVPAPNALMEQLRDRFNVPADRAKECMEFLLADARYVGFIHKAQAGGEFFNLAGAKAPAATTSSARAEDEDDSYIGSVGTMDIPETVEPPRLTVVRNSGEETPPTPPAPEAGRKLFIAHGKDRGPLEEIKKNLDRISVPYAVAVDEANRGRPISAKVATLMREECSAAIFIFTADEHSQQTDQDGNLKDVWRPSENVVYELGAASILYGNRIVIFKDSRVTLPSDFSDLGYIPFEEGKIAQYSGNLIQELVELKIIKVTV
jgi:predicted nucleotide-binding protein